MPSKLKGNTHEAVLRLFDRSRLIPKLNDQKIGISNAIDWLIEQRNLANYTQSRFCDPSPTECLRRIAENSMRQYIEAYVSDALGIYCLDGDHAMLAFPIELAKAIRASFNSRLDSEERAHLIKLFADRAGPIAVAQELLPPPLN